MSVSRPAAQPALRRIAGCILLFAVIFLAYLPALRAGFLDIWDDGEYVSRNPALTAAGGLQRIWTEPRSSPQYYPLVFTTFWVERRLWGLDPRGYHAVNIALHAANAALLWRVLVALGVPGAFVAALLFGVQPVHVESVAWITERKNLLSAALYLLSLAVFLRFFRLTGPAAPAAPADPTEAGRRRWDLYGIGLLLFAGALFSKTVTASLPVALLLALWWKRGRVAPRELVALAPLVALGGALGLVTAGLEQAHVGAVGREWAFTLGERLIIAGRALWFYLGKLAWPHPTVFIYPRWSLDAAPWWQLLLFPGYLALLGLAWARRRWGRGPLAAGIFFLVTLAPALGFFAVYPMRYSFVADHFQYLASVGPLALAAAAAAVFSRRLRAGGGNGRARRLGAAVCSHVLPAGIAVVFGVLTWRQAHAYRDQETITRDTIAKNPAAWIAQLTLGQILLDRWTMAPALEHLDQALRLKPDDGEVQNLYGLALLRSGRPAEAVPHFQEALRVDPDLAAAQQNLLLARALLQSKWGVPGGGGR